MVEFFRSCAHGSAVVGVGDFPENYILVAGLDLARMARRNVAVDFAVNEEDWDLRGGDGIRWRNLLHVEVVLETDIEESEFDDGAEESASKPGAEVKGLAHAIVGDLAKTGERRFSSNSAEVRLDGERLQEFGRAHGLAESEDAVRVIVRREPIEPLANVFAFKESVGCKIAAACTVAARIRK